MPLNKFLPKAFVEKIEINSLLYFFSKVEKMGEVQQLKTNTRWKKDPKFAPSPPPPRKIIWKPDEAGRGEYRARDRDRGGG